MTVAEKTLARLDGELADLIDQRDTEENPRWLRMIEREISDVKRRIDQAHSWADTPMGRAEAA